MPTAPYDQIADWYEHEFLDVQAKAGYTTTPTPSASIGRWLIFWLLAAAFAWT